MNKERSSIQLHISQIFQNNKILNSFNSRYTQKCDNIELIYYLLIEKEFC